MTYMLVTKEEAKEASSELETIEAVRVQGTMKTHAVTPVDDQIIRPRDILFQYQLLVFGQLPSYLPWVGQEEDKKVTSSSDP